MKKFFLLIFNFCLIGLTMAQVTCPSDVTIDGITYSVVKLGSQCWTVQNMRHSHYADGTDIVPAGMIYVAPAGTTLDPAVYGLLYMADAATRNHSTDAEGYVQGICPDGWHIPLNSEVQELMANHSSEELMSTEAWLPGGGTNASGFNMLPAGFYNAVSRTFERALVFGSFWTVDPAAIVIYHQCQFGSACSTYEVLSGDTSYAISVRCVRSAQPPTILVSLPSLAKTTGVW